MKKRRLICLLLTLLLILCCTVASGESKSENFYPFTRTGDPATDIVNVAVAQDNRTESSLGYTVDAGAWCADFVSDCAKLIDQGEAIPFHCNCASLYNLVLNAGGTTIPEGSQQKGDLIFYWASSIGVSHAKNHVGIMRDANNCISGNMGRVVRTLGYLEINQSSRKYITFVRPSWRSKSYSITYNANGGTGAPPSQTATGSTTLSAVRPTRAGYSFLGWSTDSSATAASYAPGAAYSGNTSVVLYAVWRANTYTVKFDCNGQSVYPSIADVTVTYDSVYGELPVPSVLSSGYTFGGWFTSATGGTRITSDTIVKITDTQTLYAHWVANKYTITFDANGGTVSPETKTVTYGQPIGSLPIPVRTGYRFDGWYTIDVETGGAKVNEDTVFIFFMSAGGGGSYSNLQAHWTKIHKLILPAALTRIEAEAFMGDGSIMSVTVPSQCAYIGSKAFANCKNLFYILIPRATTSIAADAFSGDDSVTIYCYPDSAAHQFAAEKGLDYVILQSDWVLASEMPQGARITDEKWTYTLTVTKTKTSTATSMAGYKQTGFKWQKTGTGTWVYAGYPEGFDTNHELYSKYQHAPLKSSVPTDADTTKRTVADTETRITYIYYHWSYSKGYLSGGNYNVYVNPTKGKCSEGYDCQYFAALELNEELTASGNVYKYWRDNPDDGSWWWYRFPVSQQTYTDYEKLFTYVKTTTEEKESSTEVTPSDSITNVQHWVKYSF